jgi:hypothetical protein
MLDGGSATQNDVPERRPLPARFGEAFFLRRSLTWTSAHAQAGRSGKGQPRVDPRTSFGARPETTCYEFPAPRDGSRPGAGGPSGIITSRIQIRLGPRWRPVPCRPRAGGSIRMGASPDRPEKAPPPLIRVGLTRGPLQAPRPPALTAGYWGHPSPGNAAGRDECDSLRQAGSWPHWCLVSKQVLPCRPRSSVTEIDRDPFAFLPVVGRSTQLSSITAMSRRRPFILQICCGQFG